MQIRLFTFNPFSQNTYLLTDDSKECVIIDPGCYFDEEKESLKKYIDANELSLTKVLYTHCHLDHAFGAKYLGDTFPDVTFVANKEEQYFIDNFQSQAQRFNLPMDKPPVITEFVDDNDIITFGNTSLKALLCPGHSPGSLCYYSEKDAVLFAGDVLFNGSIGRTDLEFGDYDVIINSIATKLKILPDNTTVYCGHGPKTTIGKEKVNNPYIK